jgi:plastocyanin
MHTTWLHRRRTGGFSLPAVALLVVGVSIVGYLLYRGATREDALLSAPSLPPPPPPNAETVLNQLRFVSIHEVNGSGINGPAVLQNLDGSASVEINISGTAVEPAARAAHIHKGTCKDIGEIAYELQPVTNGISQTVLEAPFLQITENLPLLIAVHEGASLPSPIAACGDIPDSLPAATAEDSEAMEGGDAMENAAMSEGDGVVVARPFKEFAVTGKNFEFSLKEIRVVKGDYVRINFTSTDGFHDWMLDEFNVATERVTTGNSASVEFVADKTGSFEYYCSVGNHKELGMKGALIIE